MADKIKMTKHNDFGPSATAHVAPEHVKAWEREGWVAPAAAAEAKDERRTDRK